MFKINFLLLALILFSSIYVVKQRTEIRMQVAEAGRASEDAIRLHQHYADVFYEYAQAILPENVQEIARSLKMHPVLEKKIEAQVNHEASNTEPSEP